jgi:hypothetical protein
MKITKDNYSFKKRITLQEGDQYLYIDCVLDSKHQLDHFCWSIDNPSLEQEYDKPFTLSMTINKEDEGLYRSFDLLYENIDFASTFMRETNERCEFKKEDNMITWYSDELKEIHVSNYMNIIRRDNAYDIEFHTIAPVDGLEKDNGSSTHISIRFSDIYSPLYSAIKKHFDTLDNSIESKQKPIFDFGPKVYGMRSKKTE